MTNIQNVTIDNINLYNLDEVKQQAKSAAIANQGLIINDIDPELERVLDSIPPLAVPKNTSIIGIATSVFYATGELVVPKNTSITGDDLRKLIDVLGHIDDLLKDFKARYSSSSISSSLGGFYGVGSIMAQVSALIVETAAQQRESNRQEVLAQTELLVENIHEQADKMRKQAMYQLASGILSGLATMGQGAMSIAGSVKAFNINKTAGIASDVANSTNNPVVRGAHQSFAQELNTKATLVNEKFSGGGSLIKGGGDLVASGFNYLAAQEGAEIKDLEAEQARINAQIENLKAINDSLKELIDKSISVSSSIIEQQNNTTSKILG